MAYDDESWWGERHGYEVHVDNGIGHLWVIHDGKITWDQLQAIKNEVWGFDAARSKSIQPRAMW